MDPALFRMDWDVVAEVLTTIIVLSFFVERALSLLFEHRYFVDSLNSKGIKEPIAFAVSYFVVATWQFDALSIILHGDETTIPGYLITAAIISGGSKASLKLFQDVFGAKSKAAQAADSPS